MAAPPDSPAAQAGFGEADVIRWLTPGDALSGVTLGIGDDGAILTPTSGHELVIATDAIVEGTHFAAGTPARAIGHRALAVNLSDLAAMGATPRWATLALSLPAVAADWIAGFAAGFAALAARSGTGLVGGDTVAGPLFVSVTVLGELPPGAGVTRAGGRAGDAVFVTGTPGDAVVGRLTPAGADDAARRALRDRFLYPEPRLAVGTALRGLATAMIDVSDGLDQDLRRLAAASGIGLALDVDRLPLSPALRQVAGAAAIDAALVGGDDYELAFLAPATAVGRIAALAATTGCAITPIGVATAAPGVRWSQGGREFPVPAGAWQHFGAAP